MTGLHRIDLVQDSADFKYTHHLVVDTFDKVKPEDLLRSSTGRGSTGIFDRRPARAARRSSIGRRNGENADAVEVERSSKTKETVPESWVQHVRDCEERLDNHEGKPRAKPNLLRPFPALPERPAILTYGQLMERLDRCWIGCGPC
jgi:hypothetical protein